MRTVWYGLAVAVTVAALPIAAVATLAAGAHNVAVGVSRGLHLRGVRAGREQCEKRLKGGRRG